MQDKITFRSLTNKDVDLMYNWLIEKHVHEWFASTINISMDFIKEHYLARFNRKTKRYSKSKKNDRVQLIHII